MQHRSNGHRGRPAACRSVRRAVRSDAPLGWLFTALVWIAAVSSAAALERDRAMSQYIRDEWGSARGYPGGAVHAIAQSRDGYLWIAAERGLVRFDGVKFELIEVSSAATGGGTSILGVAADPDGGILARPAGPALFDDQGWRSRRASRAPQAHGIGRDGDGGRPRRRGVDVFHEERPAPLSPGAFHEDRRRLSTAGSRRPCHGAGE